MAATIIPLEELRSSPTAALFEGGDEIAASIFVTQFEAGQGPGLHVHPYAEVFVVETGTAGFTVGDEEITVAEGHIVVVPPETPHGFKAVGDETLRVLSVHPRGKIEQAWL